MNVTRIRDEYRATYTFSYFWIVRENHACRIFHPRSISRDDLMTMTSTKDEEKASESGKRRRGLMTTSEMRRR